MTFTIPPLIYALMATICFSYASTIFTEFSRKISPLWMNSFKAFVATIAFWITIVFLDKWPVVSPITLLTLLSSGCIGLMIADIFLLHSMKELGVSRVLMIFGLQPFFLGLGAFLLFDQQFHLTNFIGVLLMLGCLYTISLENYKKSGSWQIQGLIFGLIAIVLDSIGVLLTRYGFNNEENMSSLEANAIRCVGAIIGFFLVYFFKEKIEFKPVWKKLSRKDKSKIILGSIAGTYLSLMLYLNAVSKGELSVVSSVSATGPMFAGLFESIKSKRWPSKYLIIAFIFFISGFLIFSRSLFN